MRRLPLTLLAASLALGGCGSEVATTAEVRPEAAEPTRAAAPGSAGPAGAVEAPERGGPRHDIDDDPTGAGRTADDGADADRGDDRTGGDADGTADTETEDTGAAADATGRSDDGEPGGGEAADDPSRAAGSLAAVRRAAAWRGRWEAASRDGICIELRGDGRFELTRRQRGRGDVVVTGRYSLRDDGEASVTVELSVRRVRQERYVSACRRHVFPERELPSASMLGVSLRPGRIATFTLRHGTGRRGELCGTRGCQALRRRG